jgi:hypothetical protein
MQIEEINLEFKQLHRKFINDFNLPLQVVENPYFEERIKLLENSYGASTSVFEKENILKPSERLLMCCPATYYPQVYKCLHGLEISENDLVFYYEHELCKFLTPIKLIK